MSETKRTAGKWSIIDSEIVDERGVRVALRADVNQAYIVLAVNSHDELLEACKAVLGGYDHPENDGVFDWPSVAEQLRAAIEKAEK